MLIYLLLFYCIVYMKKLEYLWKELIKNNKIDNKIIRIIYISINTNMNMRINKEINIISIQIMKNKKYKQKIYKH